MTVRWLSEADVVDTLDMTTAVAALRGALALEAAGTAKTTSKAYAGWEIDGTHATLHAVGAAIPALGLAGTKTWVHTPAGAAPHVVLFDAANGSLRAIVEAFALGQLRTGAMSGVATDLLAAPDADELAIVGTGKQAFTQVAGVAAVRSLRLVRIGGRDRTKASRLAERVSDELGVPTAVAASPTDAVRDAPIVTLVTRAREPVVGRDDLARGAHLNAVGAITPERIEFAPELLDRAALVVADSVPQARELSAELRAYYGNDDDAWSTVRRLSDVVTATEQLSAGAARPAHADVTVFKSLGIGLADVAVAARLLAPGAGKGLARAGGSGAAKPVAADGGRGTTTTTPTQEGSS